MNKKSHPFVYVHRIFLITEDLLQAMLTIMYLATSYYIIARPYKIHNKKVHTFSYMCNNKTAPNFCACLAQSDYVIKFKKTYQLLLSNCLHRNIKKH